MSVFYWVMGVLITSTFVPSALCLLLYAATGEAEWMRRARALWNFTRVLTLFGINVVIWGNVAAGLWQLWFK